MSVMRGRPLRTANPWWELNVESWKVKPPFLVHVWPFNHSRLINLPPLAASGTVLFNWSWCITSSCPTMPISQSIAHSHFNFEHWRLAQKVQATPAYWNGLIEPQRRCNYLAYGLRSRPKVLFKFSKLPQRNIHLRMKESSRWRLWKWKFVKNRPARLVPFE
jgi:hypothetical protein